MQLFDENKTRNCCCNDAFKKGIFTKNISSDSFCIYGNLMHGKNILINYAGKLTKDSNFTSYNKKESPNVYLYYCFDNNWENKRIVNMSVCSQSNNLSYCTIIENIPECTNINIAFTNDNDKWDTDSHGTYCLKVYPDIEKAIMKRYGLDSTPPAVMSDKLPSTPSSFISILKDKIVNIFSRFKSQNNI